MLLILDASPLIAFYSSIELDDPRLLHSLATNNHQLMIPQAVFDEIRRGHKDTLNILLKAIADAKVTIDTEVSFEETERFVRRHPKLHEGEAQVLLLGLKKSASGQKYYCIIDETPGRQIAQENKLSLKGTRGLIAYLRGNGIIDGERMASLLYRLDHCNFRS